MRATRTTRLRALRNYVDHMDKRRRAPALSVSLVMALVAGLAAAVAPPASAANGTGYYSTWQAPTPPQNVKVIGEAPAMPMGDLYQRAGLGVGSGATVWIPATTAMGKVYGSSQNRSYLTATVPSAGATDTITFDSLTPATGWSFALGDVDAESIKISARDQDGTPVAVNGWFESTFNYCEPSPRSSGCAGAQTDKPQWNGTNTLTGNGVDTHGASGWFTPTRRIKSLTFTSTVLVGLPSYQLWIATDKTVPSTTSPVTIEAFATGGRPPNMKVDLGGTTKRPNVNVYVYRAKKPGGKAKLVASTTSSKKKKWKTKRVPMGKGSTAYFCARVGTKFSNTLRVKGTVKAKSVSLTRAPRGDVIYC